MIHWITTWLGLDNAAGSVYAFWSGIGSDLGELTIVLVVWRKVNCHAKGCLRIGMHNVGGTHFVTCRKHHPVHEGSRPATAEQIKQEWRVGLLGQ